MKKDFIMSASTKGGLMAAGMTLISVGVGIVTTDRWVGVTLVVLGVASIFFREWTKKKAA